MPAEHLITDATKTDSGTRPQRAAVALLALGADTLLRRRSGLLVR
jgi:MYXO-CTERM domain-containing protein